MCVLLWRLEVLSEMHDMSRDRERREGGRGVVGTCIFEKGGRNIEWGEWREGWERKKEGFPDAKMIGGGKEI